MVTTPKRERTKCEIYSRVCGYLRPVDQWNPGKVEEFKNRTVFKIPEELKAQEEPKAQEVSNARKPGGRIRRKS